MNALSAETVTDRQSDLARYLVVSSDSHAGPSLEHDLRPYCPSAYLSDFDDFVRYSHDGAETAHGMLVPGQLGRSVAPVDPYIREACERTLTCRGHSDPSARLVDMDADGIAAEVIFAGGQNNEPLPFIGIGWDAGLTESSPELRAVGAHIWNSWLADFVSAAPQRLLGVVQIPIWDVPAAVRELEWAHARGLHIVNLPAPRRDLPAYNGDCYEPLWSACGERNMTLVTHGGGGERPMGVSGRGGKHVMMSEVGWLSRRHLAQLIFGGVFERHPQLKLVLTEQRVAWVGPTLRELDSIYLSEEWARDLRDELPRRPSDYWASNCFNSGSFLAPWEAELRHEVGVANLLWGSDYPHYEGTWPDTLRALRNTFADMPYLEARAILGDNALRAYGLDGDALRRVADHIGPLHEDVARPLRADERPSYRNAAFRTDGCNSV